MDEKFPEIISENSCSETNQTLVVQMFDMI